MSRPDERRRPRVPLWLVPALLALILFLPSGEINVTDDGWGYMTQGLNLATGHGYADTDGQPWIYRGPVFAFWLALFYKLFGASVATSYVAVRLSYGVNALLVYLLTARLLGRGAGLTAALLAATSASLADWSGIVHIDPLLPALVLGYLLLLLAAFEAASAARFAAAGVVLGVAFLFKELAVLFAPLPVLWWAVIGRWRTARRAGGVALGLAVAAAIAALWWFHLQRLTGRFLPLGPGPSGGAVAEIIDAFRRDPGWVLAALIQFYRTVAAPAFGFAPLFALAWLAAFVWAVRGREWARVLSAAFLCFLPMLLYQGLAGWRPRHAMILFLLSEVALVGSVWAAIAGAARRWPGRARWRRAVLATAAGGLLVGQLAADRGRWLEHVRGHDPLTFARRGWSGTTSPRWDKARATAAWLHRHVEPGTVLMGDDQFRQAIYFLAAADYPIHPMPVTCSQRYSPDFYDLCRASSMVDGGRPLFLWQENRLQARSQTRTVFVALQESRLLAEIERRETRYVMVGYTTGFEALYFDRNPSFRRVAEFGRGAIKLFAVERPRSEPFVLHVEGGVADRLRRLRRVDPAAHRDLDERFFQRALGLGAQGIAQVEGERYPLVAARKIY